MGKMKISKEVYDALVRWRNDTFSTWDSLVNLESLDELSELAKNWWTDEEITDKKGNNRLIAIIRWVNSEDVFEVEKPKKWIVRSKLKDDDGDSWYVFVENDIVGDPENYWGATRFDTKEEAESWANAHQEVIEVNE